MKIQARFVVLGKPSSLCGELSHIPRVGDSVEFLDDHLNVRFDVIKIVHSVSTNSQSVDIFIEKAIS